MATTFRFIILLLLSIFTFDALAQTEASVQDSINQSKLQQYRQTFWDSLPNPNSWVNDFDSLYFKEEKRSLDSIISIFKAETEIEIAIVTIDTNFIEKQKFDELALHFANTWKVGEKEKDNGILIAISKGFRKMRIINGYGIEKLITDAQTKDIIDNYFIPEFKHGNYYKGTESGLIAFIELLKAKLK